MKLWLFLICFPLIMSTELLAQTEDIHWLSFDKLTTLYKQEQKPILVFLYTDWCKYCRMQENTTFKDSVLIHKLNKDYYVLKLNAESKEAVSFFGRKYQFNVESGFHELASYLGNTQGRLEFPTTLILNKRLETIFRKNALVSTAEMKGLLE